MTTLRDRTVFITGGSRGIGRAIALRAAADGANIVIAAKTDIPHPKLPGTIHSVADEIVTAGGRALPLVVDVRNDDQIAAAVDKAAATFGGIDVLVNNASAIFLEQTLSTPMSRFDLVLDINVRGTFAVSQACLPHLARSTNPHILTLSPPLELNPKWFAAHCAYTMSKYAMSMTVLGLAAEFRDRGIAVNALWPQTMIETAASSVIGVEAAGCRTTEIMSDAAHAIVTSLSSELTGHFFIDEDLLRQRGSTDFRKYEVVPGMPLVKDLFVA
uniref:Short chain dehydrogenase n=1 Tax=Rhodococcus sp. (strain TK6) TaxID=249095 RepID=Q6TMA5_RHOS6|nr:short chain dehydrogenase [Rhodococcus sp. TK6]